MLSSFQFIAPCTAPCTLCTCAQKIMEDLATFKLTGTFYNQSLPCDSIYCYNTPLILAEKIADHVYVKRMQVRCLQQASKGPSADFNDLLAAFRANARHGNNNSVRYVPFTPLLICNCVISMITQHHYVSLSTATSTRPSHGPKRACTFRVPFNSVRLFNIERE